MSKNKLQLAAVLIFAASFVTSVTLTAQTAGDRVNVPLTDPSRPAFVKANLLNGSIIVKAYEGKEVLVEATPQQGESRASNGMKRIPMVSTGLSVEEENNQVKINADSVQRPINLTISVPARTSLNLRTVNDGNIVINGVDGELDVNNVNGNVTMTNVSGNAVAHALNGKVLVTFNRINGKPMAFSSLNGDIDVTFPADLKANISLSSDRGDVFSDFDVQMQQRAPQQVVEDGRSQGGRYRVHIDKAIRGTINGGGQEIQFKNFNGSIYIRKAGASKPEKSE